MTTILRNKQILHIIWKQMLAVFYIPATVMLANKGVSICYTV